MIASWSTRLNVERLNHGMPLISADAESWDNGYTLNPTAIRLKRSSRSDDIIEGMLGVKPSEDPRLGEGIVAVLYRGVPAERPGQPTLRSAVGLAVFTPELELIKRSKSPVLVPTNDPMGADYNGVEDQRVTKIGDTFYMIYCGFNPKLSRRHNIHVCMAESKNLVNWTKLGPVKGSVNDVPNKDAVLLSEPVDGHYVMLHRPCIGWQGSLSVSIAISDHPTGEWRDLGTIIRPIRHPRYAISWVGAGSTPLSLGNKRFLADYHTGNYYSTGERDYFASYAILNFNRFDLNRPDAIVESRCEGVLMPETQYERNSPWPHPKPLNCVFPCGSYIHGDDVIITYGGADAYVLGAKVNKEELISQLEGQGMTRIPGTDALTRRITGRVPKRHIVTGREVIHAPSRLVEEAR